MVVIQSLFWENSFILSFSSFQRCLQMHPAAVKTRQVWPPFQNNSSSSSSPLSFPNSYSSISSNSLVRHVKTGQVWSPFQTTFRPQRWNRRNHRQLQVCGGKVGWSAIWIIDSSTSEPLLYLSPYTSYIILIIYYTQNCCGCCDLGTCYCEKELSNKFSPGDGPLRAGWKGNITALK